MKIHRALRSALLVLLAVVGIPMLLLVSCQHKLIYFPRAYPPTHDAMWAKQTQGKVLTFSISAGKQQAYFFRASPQNTPQRLWLVCGGNGTLATEWTEFMRHEAPREDAYLLIDYPGYGANEGAANPDKIRESLRKALPLAAAELSWDDSTMKTRTRIFGHSLGCAVALIGAEEFSLERGVLLAPFTSTMDMAKEVVGLSVGFLVTHRYDNTNILHTISQRPGASIHIFHGKSDGVIPPSMAQQLHDIAPHKFPLTYCEKAGHNNLPDTQCDAIVRAMQAVQ
jgi:uncharacterized protein